MPSRNLTDALRRLRPRALGGEATSLSDRELLGRFVASRDEVAFEHLVVRHGAMVLDICRRALHDPHAAEDAFQATFLVLVRKAHKIGRSELLANWLYGVARRTAARARADAAKRKARESATPARPAGHDPLDGVTVRDLLAVLHDEIGRLPAPFRGPLIACHLEGKTRDEAAMAFGWSLATVARRLERGRELLRARLTRRGLTLTAALSVLYLPRQISSASVPMPLAASTVQAAATVAGGGNAASVVSSRAAALSEGVLNAMFRSKLKQSAIATALVGVLGAGLALNLPAEPTQAAPAPKAAAPKGGVKELEGKWEAVSIETWQGNSNKNLKIVKVDPKGHWTIFDGDRMVRPGTGADGKPGSQSFKVTFETDRSPPRMTVYVTKGNEAWKVHYIYEVKGDTLRLCCFGLLNPDGTESVGIPTAFSLDDDPRNPRFPRLETWTRIKER
jgi:RNA polymerase sigma factor (sigma-70 family)